MMLGGSSTEAPCQRSSGNCLQAVSSVEDVQVALSQPLSTCVNGQTHGDYREDAGHPNTKDRAYRSAS
jgi:hypothetical protein